jgi:hypothetical protein
MNRVGTVVLGASALIAATVDSGWARRVEAPNASQARPTNSVPAVTESSSPQPTPLLTIGRMRVYLWAPVEPTYDANTNRNLAADPLWESGMPTAQGDFGK